MRTALAAIAGAGLIGLLDALLGLGWHSAEAMRSMQVFTVLAGNAVVAALMGLLLSARGREPVGGFCAGLVLGAGPLFAQAVPQLGATFGFPFALIGGWLAAALAPRGPRALAGRLLPLAGLLVPAAMVVAVLVHAPRRDPLPVDPGPALDATPRAIGMQRPDVIVMVVDTLRADAVLDPLHPAVHVDALRARGTSAPWAVAPSNQTRPSHLALLNGLAVEKIGMRANADRWPRAQQLETRWGSVPIAERFRRAGYRTAAVAANPVLNLDADMRASGLQDFAQGFEVWNGLNAHDPWEDALDWKDEFTWLGWLNRLSFTRPLGNVALRELFRPKELRLLRRQYLKGEPTVAAVGAYFDVLLEKRDQPYFLFVNVLEPHAPYLPPPAQSGAVTGALVRPAGFGDDPTQEHPMRMRLRRLLRGEPAGPQLVQRDALAAWLHGLYQEEVLYADELLGRILARVEQVGRPTLVFFTSDHGEEFGEAGFLEHGESLHQTQIAVPFVLAGPGVPEGRVLGQAPRALDGIRTLLGLAGIDAAGVDGRDLFAVTDDAGGDGIGQAALTVMNRHCALQDGRWKFVCQLEYGEKREPGQYSLVPLALYDLRADPQERADRRAADSQVAARMEAELRRRLDRYDLHPFLEERVVTKREQDKLAELGYVDQ
ncbi:MAG TPA: sulfatase-like hydrolase/transferase [Planctomycetota bacterium]